MKRLIPYILLSLAACAFNANAAIINADTAEYNAYQDTDTGLVWLDFGENNNQSYNYVASQLGDGGEWAGWRLPTSDEVYTMWANVANLDGIEADFEYPDAYGTGQLYASHVNPIGGDTQLWSATLSVMGFNAYYSYSDYAYYTAYGFFDGSDGLSYVRSVDVVRNNTPYSALYDQVQLYDARNLDAYRNAENAEYSTLLVRDETHGTSVSEPTTLAIFALSLLGLAARRQLR